MAGLEVFWPYLWLGQWTHIGKGTSMGMGAYTIQSDKLAN
jgi:CRISPR/Cas system endoribonuclease Cas6 (RAMP superfamily)